MFRSTFPARRPRLRPALAAVLTLSVFVTALRLPARGGEPEAPAGRAPDAARPPAAEPLYFETNSTPLRRVEEHARSVAFSPDGKRLAVGHGRWDTPGAVRVWDLETKRELAFWPLPRGVASVVISPDGRWLAYSAWDNRLRIRELASLELKHDTHIGPRIARLAFSPDSTQLAFATEDGVLKTLDSATGREIRSFGGAETLYRLQYVSFSPDGQRLAAGGGSFDNPTFGRATVFGAETGEPLATFEGDLKRPVMALAFSPDGATLLTANNDATARLWNAATGEQQRVLGGHRGGLDAADFSPDGKLALTAGGDGTLRLWDAPSANLVASWTAHAGGVVDARFSPDGTLIASGGNDKLVKLWHVETRQQMALLQPAATHNDPPLPVLALAVSRDGGTVATGGDDGSIRLRDARTGEVRATLTGHADAVLALSFPAPSFPGSAWEREDAAGAQRLASGGYDRTVRLWNVSDGSLERVYEGHEQWVYAVALSPDGRTVASGDFEGIIHLWEAESGNRLLTIEAHRGPVRALAFTPDGERLVSGGGDRTARVWDVSRSQAPPGNESGSELLSLDGHRATIRDLAVSPDGRTIATAGDDRVVRLWNAGTGELVRMLEGHTGMVWCLAFSPAGRTLASGGFDDQVILWDPESGRARQRLTGHSEVVTALAFAPDGSGLITGSYDQTLRLWKAKPGVAPFTGHEGDVRAVAFSPDGRLVASGGHDATIRLWNVADGQPLAAINSGLGGIRALAFSPDGAVLAAGSWGRAIGLWDAGTHEQIAVLRHEQHDPTGLAFSADGRKLFSSGWDGTAIAWDVEKRQVLFVTPPQTLPLTSVALAPDGRTFATTSGTWREPARAGQVKLWNAQTGEELAEFTGHTAIVYCVRYTADGSKLYSISRDRSLRGWNVADRSPAEVHQLPAPGGSFVLLPGDEAAAVHQGTAVILWDRKSRRKIADLGTHEGNIYEVALSPDARTVATASQDSSIRLWPLPAEADEP